MSTEVTLIADDDALGAWLARHVDGAPLSIDTEADGMFRYRARLCVLQLAAGDAVAIVDTLAVDVRRAGAALDARGPRKLIHDLAFDARLLAEHDIALGPVFDSSVAARFLGLPSTGLKALLASELDIALDKSLQQADWGLRPFAPEALHYLSEDVRHLPALRDALRVRLRAADIEAEVDEECAYALAEARKPRVEPTPFARLSGGVALDAKARARLYALANVRERLAEARDVPAGRYMPSGILIAAAQSGHVPSGAARYFAREDERSAFHEALAQGAAESDAPEHELARMFAATPPPATIKLHKARRSLLLAFRERAAKERGVDPQVVLPGHCVQAMLSLPGLALDALEAIPGFGSCRVERHGAALVAELAARWNG